MENHHAYLFFGNSLETTPLPELYKKSSIDISHVSVDVLTIGDVRTIILDASRTPFEGKYRICVVLAREIAHEAQHALLKILEEPPVHAKFYFILGKTAVLLPTLRSRFSIESGESQSDTNVVFAQFMKASLSDRLTLIAEKTKEKDSAWIELIMCGFEERSSALKKKSLLRTVIVARTSLKSRGASVKMILEDLVLSLEE